ELAERAGLQLVARSEINANPKDTADHPFGVWTLPPTRRSPEGNDPNFDRAKYDAIGESDRMTLKFTKLRCVMGVALGAWGLGPGGWGLGRGAWERRRTGAGARRWEAFASHYSLCL